MNCRISPVDAGKPYAYKWRAVAAAVAASLGLALLIAVLVLLITNLKLSGSAEHVSLVQGVAAPSLEASSAVVEDPAQQLPIYRAPPRLLQLRIPTTTRPPTTTTQAPVQAPVTTFSSSFLPPEVLYGSSTGPPEAAPRDPWGGPPKGTNVHHGGPSPVSLALLVTELLLVHDVQRLSRQNDTSLVRALLSDEEALALSSLFLSPGRVRELLEARANGPSAELRPRKRPGGWVGDARELIMDGIRLGGNLWKAYVADAASNGGKTALQCIWTLYCRNLEKMGNLKGPYGLAGRMNGLGLRLAMKDASAEDVFNFVAREMHAVALEKVFGGEMDGHMMVLERVLEVGLGLRLRSKREDGRVEGSEIDCSRLFPRCNPLEAPQAVIKMVLEDES